MGVMPSPITGSAGNIEFLLHARHTAAPAAGARRPGPTVGPWWTAPSPRPTGRGTGVAHGPIAFYTHPDPPRRPRWPSRAAAWLADHGHRSITALRADGSVSIDGADLLVSLGGDGTLLRAVVAALDTGIPVLASTSAGSATSPWWSRRISSTRSAAFLAGTHQVEERMTLEVTVTGPDGRAARPTHGPQRGHRGEDGARAHRPHRHPDRRPPLRDLRRRRPAGVDAHRIHGLQPLGPGPRPLARACGPSW